MTRTYPHKGHVIRPPSPKSRTRSGWEAVVKGEVTWWPSIKAAKDYIEQLEY